MQLKEEKERKLKAFFNAHGRVAIAFSGGADSAYLLATAKKFGVDFRAYFVVNGFQPYFEVADARQFCKNLNIELVEITQNALDDENIFRNDGKRCYYCKKKMFEAIARQAIADGCDITADGTNASDDVAERAGFVALAELGVVSPLREAGITKDDVRNFSKTEGVKTWNKPSYSCLATRIQSGDKITKDKLQKIEQGESVLLEYGFSNFRLRLKEKGATLELDVGDSEKYEAISSEIKSKLQPIVGEVKEGERRK